MSRADTGLWEQPETGQGLQAWDALVLPAQVCPLQRKGALGSFHQETPAVNVAKSTKT